MTQLIRYENARTALAALKNYDEVHDVMNQAERAALYAHQANDRELIQYATEVRTRAQRRAGEMLAATEKAPAGRPAVNRSKATGVRMNGPVVEAHDRRKNPTLKDLGITKDQSANWQALAAMSEEHFEATVEAAKETAGEVTTAWGSECHTALAVSARFIEACWDTAGI